MKCSTQRYSAWNSRGAAVNDGISPVEVVAVPAVALDTALDAVGVEQVDFRKIDVEGFEPEVLKGARRLLEEGAVDALSFEISSVPLEASGHAPRGAVVVAALSDVSGTLKPRNALRMRRRRISFTRGNYIWRSAGDYSRAAGPRSSS